jgi:hypothetical protein
VVCPDCGAGTWNTHLESHKKKISCSVGKRIRKLREAGKVPVSDFYQTLKAAGIEMEKFETGIATTQHKGPKGKWKIQEVTDTRHWAPAWAVAVCLAWRKSKGLASVKSFEKWSMGKVVEHGPKKGENRELHKYLKYLRDTPEAREVALVEAKLFWKVTP